MNKKPVFESAILFLILVAQTLAQGPADIEVWDRILREQPTSKVIDLLGDKSQPSWPEIRTSYWIQKLPLSDRKVFEGGPKLALALVGKLKDDFRPETPITLNDLDRDIRRYLEAANRVGKAEGYINQVLTDCFYQLVLFRVSGWLVEHPDASREVVTWIEKASISKEDVAGFLQRYKAEDPELDALTLKLKDVDPRQTLSEQLNAVGIDEAKFSSIIFKPDDSKTSALIEKPSLVQLLGRRAGTEASARAILGMANYLRLGGRLDDKSLNDFGSFRKILGKDTRVYAATWIGKTFLDMGTLRVLRDLHKGEGAEVNATRKAFLSQVLE